MHLLTILAFACVFWRAEDPGRWAVVGKDDVAVSLATAIGLPLVVAIAAALVNRRGLRLLRTDPGSADAAHQYHHRATFILRAAAVAWFAATMFLTRWPDWFDFQTITPWLQIFGDLIALSPFLIAMVLMWVVTYPLENAIRTHDAGDDDGDAPAGWRFSGYLDFHVRHYLLVVSVPMAVILLAADLTRGYDDVLRSWTGIGWAPDFLLGTVAVAVFVFAPMLLRHIWRTHPIEAGPVRKRLEGICERIGLKCRDILVWRSDGMMINAAVMGVFAPCRYVMLSDALLDTMSVKQVEAVFGHEAGHVRHNHIQHFLLFAFVGWCLAAGLMELLARGVYAYDLPVEPSALVIQGVGVAVTLIFWGVGFGMVSRRFEGQADLFGARCVTPERDECAVPCSVHLFDGPADPAPKTKDSAGSAKIGSGHRVCATGAALFASALDRVALLNGIPHEEFSWRHASIGSRMRFLASVAGDPAQAEGFERRVRTIKRFLIATAVVASALSAWYWIVVPQPAILRLQAGGL